MFSRRLQPGKQKVALLLALVCLWLSGVAVLAHTDDLRIFGAVHSSRLHLIDHAIRSGGPDCCAACEWIQAAGPLQIPSVAVASFPVALSECPVFRPDTLHLVPFKHILLRGPPSLSA